MATLTVVKFPSPDGADEALATLEKLQGQELISLVSWPADRKKLRTRELRDRKMAGAPGGSFLGPAVRGCCSSSRSWAWPSARPAGR